MHSKWHDMKVKAVTIICNLIHLLLSIHQYLIRASVSIVDVGLFLWWCLCYFLFSIGDCCDGVVAIIVVVVVASGEGIFDDVWRQSSQAAAGDCDCDGKVVQKYPIPPLLSVYFCLCVFVLVYFCFCVFVLVCVNSTKQIGATDDFETRIAQKYQIPQLLTVQVSNIRRDSYSERGMYKL